MARVTKLRTYSELSKLKTVEERYNYLKLNESVGFDTFGFDRVFDQRFLHSAEWKRVRREVIVRDSGRDLGIEGYEINGPIVVHHMNPIDISDIEEATPFLLDAEYLITTTPKTHRAIHYGTYKGTGYEIVERTPNDTSPWRK